MCLRPFFALLYSVMQAIQVNGGDNEQGSAAELAAADSSIREEPLVLPDVSGTWIKVMVSKIGVGGGGRKSGVEVGGGGRRCAGTFGGFDRGALCAATLCFVSLFGS